MARRKALGRGLDALLGADPGLAGGADEPARAQRRPTGEGLREIPLEEIRPGRFQPRVQIAPEALEELAASIRVRGVVQPIVVRPLGAPEPRGGGGGAPVQDDEPRGAGFEIVAGERRWRAAQLAGLERIPALVRELDDESALAIALIENIQREELNPVEEARAVRRLTDEFGMTHRAVAEAIGRSRASVSNLLRLLDLAPPARALLEQGLLDMGHARALLALPPDLQGELARKVVDGGLSARATEALVRRVLRDTVQGPAGGGRGGAREDPDVRRLEQRLGERLGAPVRIESSRRGGRLVIRYHSLEELDGLLARLGLPDESGG